VMFDYASQSLQKGRKIVSKSIFCDLVEGNLAAKLGDIQKNNQDTEIGSYPYVYQGKYAVSLVVRSTDSSAVKRTAKQIEAMVVELGGKFLEEVK
jgi:molybdopterin-biosynthesis enzyme MoeA-like protein